MEPGRPYRHPVHRCDDRTPQPSGSWLLAAGNGTGMRLRDPLTGRLVHCLLTAAPVTNIVHTAGDKQRVHIAGPAGLATLDWPLKEELS